MKSYNEIANSVFERRNQYEIKQKKKTIRLRLTLMAHTVILLHFSKKLSAVLSENTKILR